MNYSLLAIIIPILCLNVSCSENSIKHNNLKNPTMNNHSPFEIISFTPGELKYYPGTIMEKSSWMEDNYVKHTEIDIPLGKSRYGGPVIDLPKNLDHPKDLRFVAQLDLAKFSPFDKLGLLPKVGQLLFFTDIMEENKGKVFYSESLNKDLKRIIVEHDDNFFLGTLIDEIQSATESFDERYVDPEEGDHFNLNEDGKTWDSFAGFEKSKIFGILADCQREEEYIKKVTLSEKLILLQVGENGFNDEGLFCVLITKEDLKNKNFNNCDFYWSQS